MTSDNAKLLVARVLNEDDDFITLEVGKRDDVTFHLAQAIDPDAKPDEFHTILFIHDDGTGTGVAWLPWEAT